MCRNVSIRIFLFLCLLPFTNKNSLLAKNRGVDSLQIGFRMGAGYKPESNFENSLKNYSTTFPGNNLSQTLVGSFDSLNNAEIFLTLRWWDKAKVGMFFGNTLYNDFPLIELNTFPYHSNLKHNLKTEYFMISWLYTWNFRKFFLETGIGLGINETIWKTNGFSISPFGYQEEEGRLSGNGLSYRLEATVNRRITRSTIFQLGIKLDYHTVPSFSGQINQNLGNYYINANGDVFSGSNEEIVNSELFQNFYSRSLDMSVGNIIVFLSGIYTFHF